MPYSKVGEIPAQLKGAGLNLSQANYWAEVYDAAKKSGAKSPAAIAWVRFKEKYKMKGDMWMLREQKKQTNSEFKGYLLTYRDGDTVKIEDVDCEGKLYEKELIHEGEWVHPQKDNVRFKIDVKRMTEWVSNFGKNLFKVPVPKRHSLDPEDNRGWLKEVYIKQRDDGKQALYGKLDIVNEKMQKAIDEGSVQDVSVSVFPYTDNQGINHGEVLRHVALTSYPHIENQDGFSPVQAEGYLCLEEEGLKMRKEDTDIKVNVKVDMDLEILKGSKEEENERIRESLKKILGGNANSFYVVGTYPDKIIICSMCTSNEDYIEEYFSYDYKLVDGNYEFSNKIPVKKQVEVVPDEVKELEKVVLEEKKDENQDVNMEKMEAEKMELEKLQLELEGIKKEKVDLESKVISLETKVADTEKSLKEKEDKLKIFEDEKKANFKKEIDKKVDSLLESGKITPALKDRVKTVLLKGGEDAILFETVLSDLPKAVDLEEKTKSESSKPEVDSKMTAAKAELEADRIAKQQKITK